MFEKDSTFVCVAIALVFVWIITYILWTATIGWR